MLPVTEQEIRYVGHKIHSMSFVLLEHDSSTIMFVILRLHFLDFTIGTLASAPKNKKIRSFGQPEIRLFFAVLMPSTAYNKAQELLIDLRYSF